MKPEFIPLTNGNEKPTKYWKSASIKIMIGSSTDEIIQELFDLLLSRYQASLEQSMKGNNFIFDCIS